MKKLLISLMFCIILFSGTAYAEKQMPLFSFNGMSVSLQTPLPNKKKFERDGTRINVINSQEEKISFQIKGSCNQQKFDISNAIKNDSEKIRNIDDYHFQKDGIGLMICNLIKILDKNDKKEEWVYFLPEIAILKPLPDKETLFKKGIWMRKDQVAYQVQANSDRPILTLRAYATVDEKGNPSNIVPYLETIDISKLKSTPELRNISEEELNAIIMFQWNLINILQSSRYPDSTFSSASSNNASNTATNTDAVYFPTSQATPMSAAKLKLSGHEITVLIAETEEQRQQGLMYVDKMEENNGMIFSYGAPVEKACIWMKNIKIPLDAAFIDSNGRIVNIEANMKPLSTDFHCNTGGPIYYALEMNAGWFARHRIKPGNQLSNQ